MKSPLYKVRKEEGLTLEELARVVQSSRSTVHRLENGDNQPSGSLCLILIKRYEHLGLTLEHLISPELFPNFSVRKQ